MEKFTLRLLLFAVYMFVGCAVIGILGDAFGVIKDSRTMTTAEFMGAVLMWPLFFIKYLAIGIWAMLSSGFALL